MISFRTKFLSSGQIVEGKLEDPREGLNLLEALEESGIRIPYGCRSGACGVCRVRVVEGLDGLKERGFIEEDTYLRVGDSADIRLACQAELLPQPSDHKISVECTPEIPLRDEDEGDDF